MNAFTTLSLAVLAATSIALAASTASAQTAGSADASADARVVAGLSLEKLADLRFGSIIKSYQEGSVTIDPNNGSISYDGGASRGQNTSYQMAQFRASGEPGYLYTVSLPSQVVITRQGGGEQMWIHDLRSSEGAGVLNNEGGVQSFNVGGRLGIGSNQAVGVYSGSFSVAVQYQ